MVCRRMGLHCLTHNMRVDAWAILAGVIERLKNAVDLLLVKFPVQFRKTQIKTYQKRAFNTVDCEIHKPVSGRHPLQILRRAEPLVVAVFDSALRIYQVKAVMRLIWFGQPMRTSKHHPNFAFRRKRHYLFRFTSQQVPVVTLEIRKIRPHIAAKRALAEMHNIAAHLSRFSNVRLDTAAVALYRLAYRELTRRYC